MSNPVRGCPIRSIKHRAKQWFTRALRSALNDFELEGGYRQPNGDAALQKLLIQQYRMLSRHDKEGLPRFDDVGFRVYSQFEEDGILLYIFALIAPLNRTCVEICAGNGRECMTTNLIINHGWWGFLFDGNDRNVADGRRFFANHKDTFLHPPRFTKSWITAENVNDELLAAGVSGAVDLLSLDLDGMDYWVWKAIEAIEPRVVVCETHNVAPIGRAVTVPYDPRFISDSEHYRGASLEAMCRLGGQKGYRLVGTHRFGFNAFFLKDGVGEEFFPEVAAHECLNDPFSEARRKDWQEVASLPWHDVT